MSDDTTTHATHMHHADVIEGLRMELQYYRDFFWDHQKRLAQVSADNDGFFECSDGEETKALVEGYEAALSVGTQRNIEAEAESLHEHYRGRIETLQHELRNEQILRRNSEKRLLHAKEANHVLCEKLNRFAAVLHGRAEYLIPAIQLILLESSEKMWRIKNEVEALKYLFLRTMDAPPAQDRTAVARSHPGQPKCEISEASDEVAIRSKGARESLQAASLRFRLSSSITDILKNFLHGATTLGSNETWLDQLRIEDQLASTLGELQCVKSMSRDMERSTTADDTGGAGRLGVALCRSDEMLVQRCFEENSQLATTSSDDRQLSQHVAKAEVTNAHQASADEARRCEDLPYSPLQSVFEGELNDCRSVVTDSSPLPKAPLVRDLMPQLSSDDGSGAARTAQELVAKFHNPTATINPFGSFFKERATVPHSQLLPTDTLARSALILDPLLAANQKLKVEVTAIRKEKEASDGRLQAVIGELSRSREFADKKAAKMLHALTNEYEKQLDAVLEGNKTTGTVASRPSRCEGAQPIDQEEANDERLSVAVEELRRFEEIARLSKDPSLRGKMLRQMKELHGDIQSLMRRRE